MIERCHIDNGGSRVPLLVGRPDRCHHAPGLVVLQHAWGLDVFMEDRVHRLAERGYVAVAPDLFHRTTQPSADLIARIRGLRDPEIQQDVAAGIAYLRHLDDIRIGAMGVIGFCMGGRAAYVAAAANTCFSVAAVFYGGNIRADWAGGPAPIDLTAQIACPVIGFFGLEDKNPSPQDVADMSAELTRFGKPHEFHGYPGAGHAFLNFNDAPRYRDAQAQAAWDTCLALLDRYLKADGASSEAARRPETVAIEAQLHG